MAKKIKTIDVEKFNTAKKFGQSKYTRILHRRTVKGVRAGNDPIVAAVACGIHRDTFNGWTYDYKMRGKESRYAKLFSDIDKAEQAFEKEMVAAIRRGVKDDPKWAIEYLKRKKKDRWSDRTQLEMSGPNQGPIVNENIRTKFMSQLNRMRKSMKKKKEVK